MGESLTAALHAPALSAASPASPSPVDATAPDAPADEGRFRALVADHLDFTWRSLRRLGLPADLADDATQRVFLVASQKLQTIAPGSERAFLFNTAVRVASSEKRAFARRREVLAGDGTDDVGDGVAGADDLLDQQRARALLDDLVLGLELDLRTVFVLFELEGMTMAEIASTLGVPPGTVASRLRRGREEFQQALKRHQAQAARPVRPETRRT